MMKETGQTGITGTGVILTEVVLVLAAGVLWWFIRDTPFLKSAWLPWVAVMFPVTSLAVPLVLTIRNKRRTANQASEGIPRKLGSPQG
jgi:hypothetical protein